MQTLASLLELSLPLAVPGTLRHSTDADVEVGGSR
jgi:hypothetical protein